MPHPEMCYQQDFLSMVILRVDFPSASLGVEERGPFAVKIAERFPHATTLPIRQTTVSMQANEPEVTHEDIGQQSTYKKTIAGTIQLVLTNDSLTLQYGPADYTGFANFLDEFNYALNLLSDSFKVAEFSRIGIRYINEIRLPGRALEWKGIIAEHLINSVFATALPNGRIQRSMHQLSELHDGEQLLLSYGLVNPDYPAPLVQRHFVLDIDASRSGLIAHGEINDCIKKLNGLCSTTFERSIDQELRDIMKVKND